MLAINGLHIFSRWLAGYGAAEFAGLHSRTLQSTGYLAIQGLSAFWCINKAPFSHFPHNFSCTYTDHNYFYTMKRSSTTRFQLGSTPWNKCLSFESSDDAGAGRGHSYCRLAVEEFPVRPTVDSRDVSRNTMLLRPKCAESSILMRENITSSDNSRIRDNDMLQKAITQASIQHRRTSPDCQTPSWEIVDKRKWGLGWKSARECQSCGFKSQAHPTYKSVPSAKRGPDPAAPNDALAVGLQVTSMRNT